MSEIAKQMRELRDEFKQGRWRQADYAAELFDCGADEIESLQAEIKKLNYYIEELQSLDMLQQMEIERLREALQWICKYADSHTIDQIERVAQLALQATDALDACEGEGDAE